MRCPAALGLDEGPELNPRHLDPRGWHGSGKSDDRSDGQRATADIIVISEPLDLQVRKRRGQLKSQIAEPTSSSGALRGPERPNAHHPAQIGHSVKDDENTRCGARPAAGTQSEVARGPVLRREAPGSAIARAGRALRRGEHRAAVPQHVLDADGGRHCGSHVIGYNEAPGRAATMDEARRFALEILALVDGLKA